MKQFAYLEATSVEQAAELLGQHQDNAKVIAGGTALVNFMKTELVQPQYVVGLRRLEALQTIAEGDAQEAGLRIGALTTLRNLEISPLIAARAPLLAQACRAVATVRIRMMATLGGAVAHADPALDTPPALVASDAYIKIQSARGTRRVPAERFFTGIFETVLRPDELVTEIVVPPQPQHVGTAFIKFLPASQDDYAVVSVAARVSMMHGRIYDVRIALGSVGVTVVRSQRAEAALSGSAPHADVFREAAELAAADIDPMTDIRGSADYKRRMAAVHVRRALAAATAASQT